MEEELYDTTIELHKYMPYVCMQMCAYVCSPFLRHLAAYVFGGESWMNLR